jgi:ribosome-associated protein
MAAPKPARTPEALVKLAVKTLVDHKGLDPVILEVKELCSFADYFIVCSGGSRRHVLALAQHLEEILSRAGFKPLGVEGLEEGQWVLMDYNDLVIHLFLQPLREFYNLEGLWSEAPQTPAAAAPRTPSPSASHSEPHDSSDADPEHNSHE